MSGDAQTYGPHVYRNVRANWRIAHRWGSSFGDTRDYHVVRSGDRVNITNLEDANLPLDVARQIGEAILAAVAWEDES